MSNSHVNITFHRACSLSTGKGNSYTPGGDTEPLGFSRDSFPMTIADYLNPRGLERNEVDKAKPVVTIESAKQYGLDVLIDGEVFIRLGGNSKVTIPAYHAEGSTLKLAIAEHQTETGELDTRPGGGLGGIKPTDEQPDEKPRSIDDLEPVEGEDGTINGDTPPPPPPASNPPAGETGGESPANTPQGGENPPEGGDEGQGEKREPSGEDGAKKPENKTEGDNKPENAEGKPVEGEPSASGDENPEAATEGHPPGGAATDAPEGEGRGEGRAG